MKNNQKLQENEYGQFIGLPVSHSLPRYFLAKILYGKHATLQVLFSAKLDAERMQQLWQCVHGEVDHRCWTYLPHSGFESVEELRAALEKKLWL